MKATAKPLTPHSSSTISYNVKSELPPKEPSIISRTKDILGHLTALELTQAEIAAHVYGAGKDDEEAVGKAAQFNLEDALAEISQRLASAVGQERTTLSHLADSDDKR